MIETKAVTLACCLVLLGTCIGVAGCAPAPKSKTQQPTESLDKSQGGTENENDDTASVENETASIEELVDQLADVGTEGVGFHSTAWSSGFAALDEKPKFQGGVIGSEKPVVSKSIRKLVQHGVAALPILLKHLSNERETKLTVSTGQGIIMAQWHSDEYHPRFREPRLHPSKVNTGYKLMIDNYRLKVGDLCYVAIGQIVNRNLNAVRYQPSGCRVINSPIQQPALAAAVRADWFGLTEEQHRKSLIQDAFVKSPFSPAAAVTRLCFYYPEKGEEIAVKMLNRPPCNVSLVGKFIYGNLLSQPDPLKWNNLITEFKSQSSTADADSIPLYLSWMSRIASQHGEGSKSAEQYAKAKRILEQEYPDFDMNYPQFINSIWISDQSHLIEGLSAIKSEAIDEAVFHFFDRTIHTDFAWEDPIQLDDLARFCMERLIGKGHDDVFKKYCNHRIDVIQQTPNDSTQRYRLDSLKDWATRLQRP